MKFVAISDTHGQLDKIDLPEGDVLLHAGDATMNGSAKELERFNESFAKLPYKYRIFCPGNHDRICERDPGRAREILTGPTHYLVDEEVVLDGVKIYGSPWQPTFGHGWAFNANRGQIIREKWDRIPDDVDILITHGPPFYIGDEAGMAPWVENVGCVDLLEAIKNRPSIKYHIAGHIHEAYGVREVGGVTFINASSVDMKYHAANPPVVFEIKK